MKGFAGIIVLFTILIMAVILLSSIYPIKNEDTSTIFIPKIKNFITITEFNLKNMSYDCNWQKSEFDLSNCLESGTNVIFNNVNNDLVISCTKSALQRIDQNNYFLEINCTNKVLLEKNTTFNIQKRILLIAPKP